MKVEKSRGHILREHMADIVRSCEQRLAGHIELRLRLDYDFLAEEVVVYRRYYWFFKDRILVMRVDTSHALYPLFYVECHDMDYWYLARKIAEDIDATKVVKAW